MKKFILPLILLAFFLPYFRRPFALNVHGDNGIQQVMQVLRLVDTRFSFSLDPSHAYANPITQILTNFHGSIRPLVAYPLVYILDRLGVHISDLSVGIIFLSLGFVFVMVQQKLLKRMIGVPASWVFSIIFMAIPYVVLQMKGAWWQPFTYPLLIAALVFLHLFLQEEKARWYGWFCVALSGYLLSDPGFFLGGIILFLYPLVWFLHQTDGSIKKAIYEMARRVFKSKWSLLPVVTMLVIVGLYLIGHFGFEADFGILSRTFEKQSRLTIPSPSIVIYSVLQGMGVSGWLLFPALLSASLWGLVRIIQKKSLSSLFTAAVISFWLAFLLINFAGGAAGALYVLYVPGVLALTLALFSLPKTWVRISCIAVLVSITYLQTVLYNFNYPPSFLEHPFLSRPFFSSVTPGEPCPALWCPWQFGEPKNLGITTAAFVVRDYIGMQPIPFVSMQENFYVRPKEIFFYNNYEQSPSFSIGRRITYRIEELEEPEVLLVYTDELLEETPSAGAKEMNDKVVVFLHDHPEYRLTATVTKAGKDVIRIFERNGTHEYKVFPIEEYDRAFNQKYGTLRGLGHVDLG